MSETLSPHSKITEEALLGSMLLSERCVEEALAEVTASDFYSPSYAQVFEVIKDEHLAGRKVDGALVSAALHRHGVFEAVGGNVTLAKVLGAVPTIDTRSTAAYAKVVAEFASMRRLISAGDQIQQLGWEQPKDIDGAVERAEEILRAVQGTEQATASTWEPQDVTALWDDDPMTHFAPGVLGRRVDGSCLIAPGARGMLIAPRESAKSMFAMACTVEAAKRGEHSIYVDFESRAKRVMPRLRQHTEGHLARGLFHYVRPETSMSSAARRRVKRLCNALNPRLVVLDGYNALLAKQKLSGNDASDIALLLEDVVEPWMSDETCLLMIDHVAIEDQRMGRDRAMGSVAKENLVDYVISLNVDADNRIAKGYVGFVSLKVTKDRDGELRGLCPDRQTFGQFYVDSSPAGRWSHMITMPPGASASSVSFKPQVA